MQRRIHVFYSGRVQGVGFRFTTEDIARDLGVTGWVKNLRDSRVEVVAEAEESVLKDLLSRIQQHFRSYIRNADIQWDEATGEFRDFGIKLYSF
jgi:acylphosphatase